MYQDDVQSNAKRGRKKGEGRKKERSPRPLQSCYRLETKGREERTKEKKGGCKIRISAWWLFLWTKQKGGGGTEKRGEGIGAYADCGYLFQLKKVGREKGRGGEGGRRKRGILPIKEKNTGREEREGGRGPEPFGVNVPTFLLVKVKIKSEGKREKE